MSSAYVRTEIKAFLAANSAEILVDLTGEISELDRLLGRKSITRNDPWLGIQFIGDEETPVTIPATNTKGKYREIGVIYLHVVDQPKPDWGDDVIGRAEVLRNLFRGRNINGIRIEEVSPINTQAGATLNFEGGWNAGAVIISYERDLDL